MQNRGNNFKNLFFFLSKNFLILKGIFNENRYL